MPSLNGEQQTGGYRGRRKGQTSVCDYLLLRYTEGGEGGIGILAISFPGFQPH
jgi:hypothetical protein